MPIVTLPGGELRDEIRQPLYDTVVLAAGATLAGTYRFFSSVTTPSGAPKSAAQTNMKQSGSLETAVSFRVQGLCFDAQNALEANITILPVVLNKSSITLNIGQKQYWQSPARFAGGRMWAEYDASAAPAALQQYGFSAIQPVVFQGKHVIDINPLQAFQVIWDLQAVDLTAAEAALTIAAGTDQWFQASLKGLQRRPVQ
jgi:hypothetical protein